MKKHQVISSVPYAMLKLKNVEDRDRISAVYISVKVVARATSMTSRSVSVPTTITGTYTLLRTASAVETIRLIGVCFCLLDTYTSHEHSIA